MGGERITVRLDDLHIALLKELSTNGTIADGVRVLFDTYDSYQRLAKEHEDLQRQVFELSEALSSSSPPGPVPETESLPTVEKPSTSGSLPSNTETPLPSVGHGHFSPDEVEGRLYSVFSFIPESHRPLIVHLTKLFWDNGKWFNAVPASWISFGTFGDAVNDLIRAGIVEWRSVNGVTVMVNPLITLKNRQASSK